MAFRLPLDAKFLCVPIGCGLAMLTTMLVRVPAIDPESSTASFYDDEAKATKAAEQYVNIARLFDMRIKAKKFGIFDNEVVVPK